MNKHGRKTKAGKLLTQFLETIAEEKTELGENDELITKAEALARLIWKRALGYKELDVKTNTDRYYPPEHSKIGLIFERIEGKAPMAGEDKTKKTPLSARVSEVGKKNIAQAGGMSDTDSD